MTEGAGLAYILGGIRITETQYRMAEFFIANGLSVNSVNHSGGFNLSPLLGAVAANSIDEVRFLLKHGADMSMKSGKINMTPLEYAKFLQNKFLASGKKHQDRSEIIRLLKSENAIR